MVIAETAAGTVHACGVPVKAKVTVQVPPAHTGVGKADAAGANPMELATRTTAPTETAPSVIMDRRDRVEPTISAMKSYHPGDGRKGRHRAMQHCAQ